MKRVKWVKWVKGVKGPRARGAGGLRPTRRGDGIGEVAVAGAGERKSGDATDVVAPAEEGRGRARYIIGTGETGKWP